MSRTIRGTTELQAIVQSCYDLAKSQDIDTRDAARRLVRDMRDEKMLRLMASEFLVLFLAKDERSASLEAERASEQPLTLAETTGGGTSLPPRRGTRAFARWIDETEEGRAHKAQLTKWREEDSAARAHQWNALSETLQEYTDSMRMQWTQEILSTKFRLGDGTEVTWGGATLEQHKSRHQMFMKNAHANLEGAARHQQAIRDLEATGAQTLADLRAA
ncbi:hypothetical protein [Aeromicrobium sp. Leaf291]|uniref:hypothetical protein n=1 Tax=Aeromicrobium sp. Leaf291 TaxID=1736325 RepID=UPI0006F8E955|nr:hypothetical protein [Aeromicrobium sp. Leaf291]KQP83725.1 hypothetical protein ASF35_01740 [Aeromicrobium sp. Leaf291]